MIEAVHFRKAYADTLATSQNILDVGQVAYDIDK
jgi:hypothetical protein